MKLRFDVSGILDVPLDHAVRMQLVWELDKFADEVNGILPDWRVSLVHNSGEDYLVFEREDDAAPDASTDVVMRVASAAQ